METGEFVSGEDAMSEFGAKKYDDLVWEHLSAIGILVKPVPIKRDGGWSRAEGYWYRWFMVEALGGKRTRRCYRVNDDQTVERLV